MKLNNSFLLLSLIFICINPLESKKILLLKDSISLSCNNELIFDISEEIQDTIEHDTNWNHTQMNEFNYNEKYIILSIYNYPEKYNKEYTNKNSTLFLDGTTYNIKKGKNVFLLDYYIYNGLYNSSIYINCKCINNTFMKVRYSIYILDKNTNFNKYSSQLKNNQVVDDLNKLNNLNELDIFYNNNDNNYNNNYNNNLNVCILEVIKNIYNAIYITFINISIYLTYYYQYNLLLNILTFSSVIVALKYIH